MRGWRLAAIALGLLAIVLGHDALMAADPHAPAPPGAHAPSGEVAASLGRDPAGAHGRVDSDPCGLLVGLRPTAPLDLDVDLPAASVPGAILAGELAVRGVRGGWQEPGHPPDVRRALLQVFLN